MAVRDNIYPVRVVGAERVLLAGNFLHDETVEGCPGLTVSADGSGVYTLTLPGTGAVDVMSAVFTVQDTAKLYALVTDRDDDARTIEVTLHTDGGVATDLGAAPDCVHFMIVVKNSNLVNA